MPDSSNQSRDTYSDFLYFATVCETVRKTSSKLRKIDSVASYFENLPTDEDLRIAATLLSGRIFASGAEFTEINVGYSLIWQAISEFHGMKENELSEYYLKYGDMGSAVEDWLKSIGRRASTASLFQDSDLTLAEFYSSLKELARASGKGSTERRMLILKRVFSQIKEPVEAKYVLRILGGEMRIGLVEGLVEESIAKAFSKTLAEIRNANLVYGDVGQVAVLAKRDGLSEAELTLFRPTNFMLADTAENAELLYKKFEPKPILAEYKYDGIRAQIHKLDDKTRIYSRNLADVTRYFPEIEHALKSLDTKSLVLDGEIVPFHNGAPLSFQTLQRRLRKLEHSPYDAPIKYFAFDLIYLDGRSLIGEVLSARSMLLHSLDLKEPLDFSVQRNVSSIEEIQKMFDESKSLGYEGLVAKSPSSVYTPGRRGKSWVKLKKELDTLDVVIVAAEYGHGKRAGVISDYTFAVKDVDDLKVVGKAYSGLTDSEILEMTKLLKKITIQDYGYRRTVKPQVVLEVAFDAIQRSGRHNSGYALRFPRIKRIRVDKSLQEIDTLDKVEQIYNAQAAKV
jgi:DNA ligase 1